MRAGAASAGWMCGLLHSRLTRAGDWPYLAVAAPASTRPETAGEPVYFGEIVVRAGEPFAVLSDLGGTTFAFNEEASLSGYRMMIDRLAARGNGLEFFGAAVRTGSHAASIEAVVTGHADVAIIDSMVLEDLQPEGLRVLESVGPYPAPPLVAQIGVADVVQRAATAAAWVPISDERYRHLAD